MSDYSKFTFRGGLWSRNMRNRSDVAEYDFGLEKGLNFIVEHESGATVRPSFEFADYLQHDDKTIKLFPYFFNQFQGNAFMIVAGDLYLRFVNNGAYVLEDEAPITAVSTNTISAPAATYVVGDWVKLETANGFIQDTFEVTAVSGTDYTLDAVSTLVAAVFAEAPTKVSRIYTVTTTYAHTDLDTINYEQYLDQLTFTSRKYPQKIISREDAADWTLTDVNFIPSILGPTSVTTTPSVTGTSGAIYAVTAVDAEGNESFPQDYFAERASANITTTAGQITLDWAAIADAAYYKIYRSIFSSTASTLTKAQELGYLGRTSGTSFVDSNIVPDFTLPPQNHNNPFENGAITSVNMTDIGSGYHEATTTAVVVDADGSGATLLPILNDAGAIVSIKILNSGSGYTAPTITITDTDGSPGTGAAATADKSPLTGNYPQAITRWRQIQFYAGSDNAPITLHGSKPGLRNNFNSGTFLTSSDGFSDELDLTQITPIYHMTPMQTGMFIFSSQMVGQISGGRNNNFSATTKEFDPITYAGAANIRPLKIDREVIYLTSGYDEVIVLTPSNLPTYYIPETISIFSHDLFEVDNPIESWTYQGTPHKIIWAQRKDGSFLSCTYDATQKMRAWMEHTTMGCVKHVATIEENYLDRTYAVVERYGRQYLERMHVESTPMVEKHYALDSGREATLTAVADDVTLTQTGSVLTIVADSAIFTSADVGKDFRYGKGRALITAQDSTTQLTATVEIDLQSHKLDNGLELKVPAADATLTVRSTTFGGLKHLAGKTVKILANGYEEPQQTVSALGEITLAAAASYVYAGLAFEAVIKPLPITSTDKLLVHKRKSVKAAHILLKDAKGFTYSSSELGNQYELKVRTNEANGVPIITSDTYTKVVIGGTFKTNDNLTIRKNSVFGGSVLGMVMEYELGDTDDDS